MSRILAASFSVVLLATPAFAAPSFGGAGLRTASEGAEARAENDGRSVLDLLLGLYNIRLETPSPAGRAVEPSPKTAKGEAIACTTATEDAADKQQASKKKKKAAGPEPVYLAF